MKIITEAEYTELRTAKAYFDGEIHKVPPEILVRSVLQVLEKQGLVLTVEQRPLQPLAMGHYETVFSLRPARGNPQEPPLAEQVRGAFGRITNS